ncbi:hypothetical protein I4U23_001283 [Adineta vaga]|nr:hypothetical protein I4U23_001283 [Adineta vaga]
MSVKDDIRFQQPSTIAHINDVIRKNVDTDRLFHNKRELEEFIDKCESTSLSLSNQQLTDSDISIVINLGIVKKKCIELKLGYNQITSDGIKKLADVLRTNSILERLNLFANNISDQGVYYLTQSLVSKTSKLQMLFIGQNQITDKGIEYLCDLLRTNTTITHLGLSNNEISDQGVISLATVLTKQNNTLKELYLWGNKSIGDTCIDALADMLVYNRTLMKLILFDCNLSDSSKERLNEVVQPRKDFGLFL